MNTLKKVFYLLFISINILHAQRGGSLPITTVQQSPMLLGAGQTGAALPNNDVLGFYYNPAILGYSAQNNHVAFSFMPTSTEWGTLHYSDLTFNNFGLNLGYNLRESKFNLPVTIGFGLLRNKFSYGKFNNNENDDYYDSFNTYSLGIGLNYFLNFYFGLSLKTFHSEILGFSPTHYNDATQRKYEADGTLLDYGLLVIFPISKIFLQKKNFYISEKSILKPVANFSIGYSLSNYGDEFYYNNLQQQTSPFSRTARIGYTFEIGTQLVTNNFLLNIFNYSFTAEASDLLIKEERFDDDGNPLSNNGSQYQSGLLGDINFPDHLITLESNGKVMIHKGHIFKFFDTFIYTTGRFVNGGYLDSRKTNGLGFTSKGIFKILKTQITQPTVNYILNHFEIEYFNSNVEFWKKRFTNFDSLTLRFKGFAI